ncbi:MAG: hypothetical protein ABIJ46_03035 [bacterium]
MTSGIKVSIPNRILCVCMGNTCRSPIMAALLKHEFDACGLNIVVESAGLDEEEGKPASPDAVTEMAKRGLDISSHRNRLLDNAEPNRFDRILCANQEVVTVITNFYPQHMPGVVPMDRLEVVDADRGGIADPFEKGPKAYAACTKQIEAAMRRIAMEITTGRRAKPAD